MPTRRRICSALILASLLAIGHAQQPDSPWLPAFDVISVRQEKAASRWSESTPPDGYTAQGISLMMLIMEAYGIKPDYRVIGAPGWSDNVSFDIQAKVADADIPALQKLDELQRASMLQQILMDRFRLKVHLEKRIQPIYSLVMVKQGVLKEAPPPADGKPIDKGWRPGRGARAGQMVAANLTTAWLAAQLSGALGRMVVDNTGLTGIYHADFHYTPDTPGSGPAQSDNSLSIFTAVKEQLGLELVPAKGPVDCLIIDHVEMPSEN